VGRHGGRPSHHPRLDARLRAGRGGHYAAEAEATGFSNFDYTGPALTIALLGPTGDRLSPDSLPESRRLTKRPFNPANYTLGNFFQGDRTASGRMWGCL